MEPRRWGARATRWPHTARGRGGGRLCVRSVWGTPVVPVVVRSAVPWPCGRHLQHHNVRARFRDVACALHGRQHMRASAGRWAAGA